MHRQTNPFIFIVIAIAVLGIGGWLITSNETLRRMLFDQDPSGKFNIGSSQLEQIIEQLRGNTKRKWLEKVQEMHESMTLIETKRDELYDRIANGAKGQPYLAEFKKLTANHHQKLSNVDLSKSDLSLHDIYLAARDAERQITNVYRDICGAQNAIHHEVPAIDAVSWVKVVPPRRIDLNEEALVQRINSQIDGKLEAFKHNVKNGGGSIEAMQKNIAMVLEKANVDGDEELGAGWEAMSEIAFGSTQGNTLMPDELSLDDEGTSDGGFNAQPGRVISKKVNANQNLYIDKWYVMGPFENRFRSNLDSSFLPESVVDLDNLTVGKDDKEIGWEYWQMKKQRVEPDWAPRGAIYYGWTEIYVEEAGKYWVSLGSDDYGKMWVNGELVWKSDTRPKSYRADEYTAEIEFQQGVNEILFRCENNGGTMGWSVIFHLEAYE